MLIGRIYNKIIEFQSEYNHQLNLQFNILMWELGVKLIKYSKSIATRDINVVIDLCTQELNARFPSIFNQSELGHSIRFVNEYGVDQSPPINLMQLIPWACVKVLLEIKGYENRFFFAHQILRQGLSLKEIEALILADSFNFELARQEWENVISSQPTVEYASTSGHFTTNGKITIIEPVIYRKNDINRNIYKNPDLFTFFNFF